MNLDPALTESFDWRFADFVGLTGTFLDFSVFLALRYGSLSGTGIALPLLTAIGSLFVLYSLGERFNPAAAVTELSFLAMSVVCLISSIFGRLRHRMRRNRVDASTDHPV